MSERLYADEYIDVSLPEIPATQGHVHVALQNACASLDELPQSSFLRIVDSSNMISSALFELLGAHGTNIILQNNGASVSVDVIARKDGDGLNFLWEPNKGNPHELADVAKKIKDGVDYEVWARDNPEAAKNAGAPVTPGKIDLTSKTSKDAPSSDDSSNTSSNTSSDDTPEENYLLRSLRRIP